MSSKLSHIPEHKQADLVKVLKIIQDTTYQSIGAEMIILYGSYARGDFVVRDIVSEGWNTRVYESDFDMFIVTKKPTQEFNIALASAIEKKISSDQTIESHFSIIIEDIYHVNKMLEESRYFYVDMKRDGVVLHDSKKYTLASGKELPMDRKKEIQQEDFDLWFLDADTFFGIYKNMYKQKDYKIWAFQMHQATERYMTAFLLVKTGYKPKTHDLEILYEKIIWVEESFGEIFNLTDDQDSYHFELLRKAYIEARYSKDYSVTADELKFLEKKINILSKKVKALCSQEIQS